MPRYSTSSRARKGYAFITFETEEECLKAIWNFNQVIPKELIDSLDPNYIDSGI